MKKNVLLITRSQFGFLIDYYQYSLYLKEKYHIEYICWDYNRPKLDIDGVKVYYIPRNGNLLTRNIFFIQAIFKIINSKLYDRVLVNYFHGCFLLPLFFTKKERFYLDIRTASVSLSNIIRFFYNHLLRFECCFYDNLSVVSEGVKKRLQLPENTTVIPLGANYIDINRSHKSGLRLLYVGTLSNRNIDQTVVGIHLFMRKHINVNLNYSIIGSGDHKYIDKLINLIEKYNLQDVVKLHGHIPYVELESYFEESNIGVSYVPITDYFNHQPVTKTFEYLMSGLPVIATSTYENKLIINQSNGVLIEDNPKSFCEGLIKITKLQYTYDANSIKNDLYDYQWNNIVLKLENLLFNKNKL